MKGRFKPGERLVIERLAKELGTSPTPVREALLMLVKENVLEMKASSSCRVPQLSAERYKEIRKIRIELQCLAAREAMLRTKSYKKTVTKMKCTHQNLLKAQEKGDIEQALKCNQEFSMILVHQAKMPVLTSMIESLWMQVGPVVPLIFKDGNPSFSGRHPHEVIMTGVENGSDYMVCQGITGLLTESGNFIIDRLAENQNVSS